MEYSRLITILLNYVLLQNRLLWSTTYKPKRIRQLSSLRHPNLERSADLRNFFPRSSSPGSSLTNADTPLLSLPLSYIRSGFYRPHYGDFSGQLYGGGLRTAKSINSSIDFFYHLAYFNIYDAYSNSYGFTLRCVRPEDFAKDPQRDS